MAHVQSYAESKYSATSTASYALTGVVAGNALLVFTRVANGASNVVSGVSSGVDGAFTLLTDENNGTIALRTWYLENATAGNHTVTYTTVGTGVTVRWGIAEYDDVPASSVVDVSADGAFTTTTSPATSNVTTTGVNRTLVSVVATNLSSTTIASAGGESERQEVDARFQFQDEFAATAGSHGASWTLGATQPGVYAILALKPATTTTKYVKLLADSSAASATGVEVVVFNAPAGSNYVSGTTRYGSVNAQEFEASLESGNAVLKVLASDVGCDGLAAATTVAALARNTTYTTGMVEATIIEE
jgi:hypothetical protein